VGAGLQRARLGDVVQASLTGGARRVAAVEVHCPSDRFEVRRVDAGAVPAQVVEVQLGGHRATVPDVERPVREASAVDLD
jgi:hypothetical protein